MVSCSYCFNKHGKEAMHEGGVAPGMPWGPVPCPVGLDRLLCRIRSTRPVCVAHPETTPLHCLMERTLEKSWTPNLHPLSLPWVQRIADHLEGTFTTTVRESPPPLTPRGIWKTTAVYGVATRLPLGLGRKTRLVGETAPA